jgi:tRNA(Ile)-lysidine synthase TilS/MesJ
MMSRWLGMNTRLCKHCILDATTPGISINPDTGLCQFCEQYKPLSQEKKEKSRLQMDTLFKSPPKQGNYDVIFALSGGMDSCNTLYRLKNEYPHLNILAVQFDNGFISDTALENAKKFCDLTKSTYSRLALDEPQMRNTFKKAAISMDAYPGFAKYRASDICNTCISIIKQKIIEKALTTKSPYIVFAFSPGQTKTPFVTMTKPFMVWTRNLFEEQLMAMGVIGQELYLIDKKILQSTSSETEVMIIHPYLVWGYNKQKIRKECIKLGWIEPDLKDHNSSNCLLNAFAIQNHLKKYHIHPYAHDLAALVRQGYMKRHEALKKINAELSEDSTKEVQRKLHLKK